MTIRAKILPDHTAIDDQRLAGDKGAVAADQEAGGGTDVGLGVAQAAQRGAGPRYLLGDRAMDIAEIG